MTNNAARPCDSHARARQLLDHLLDQWLYLADIFKSAGPATAIAALNTLDTRFEEFTSDIDPEGLDQNWYDLGRRVFRTELSRRIDDSLIRIENRPR